MSTDRITACIVTGAPLVLEAGVVQLDEAQAALRQQRLAALGGNLYEIRGQIHLKAGERLGWPGAIPKRLAAILQPAVAQAVAAKRSHGARSDDDGRDTQAASGRAADTAAPASMVGLTDARPRAARAAPRGESSVDLISRAA